MIRLTGLNFNSSGDVISRGDIWVNPNHILRVTRAQGDYAHLLLAPGVSEVVEQSPETVLRDIRRAVSRGVPLNSAAS